jgi:hypothetical protein
LHEGTGGGVLGIKGRLGEGLGREVRVLNLHPLDPVLVAHRGVEKVGLLGPHHLGHVERAALLKRAQALALVGGHELVETRLVAVVLGQVEGAADRVISRGLVVEAAPWP